MAVQFIAPIVGAVVDIFKRRSERKNRIKEAKADAEIQRLANTSDQSGWKDEYLVVLWSIPAIMAFVPALQPYAREGFRMLAEDVPDWYMIGLLGITGAVFGLKRLIEYRK